MATSRIAFVVTLLALVITFQTAEAFAVFDSPSRMLTPPHLASSHAVADFDGDGHQDVLMLTSDYNTIAFEVVVFHGDGTGDFSEPDIRPMPLDTLSAFGLAAADIDGDGDPDLLIGMSKDPTFRIDVWRNNGPAGLAFAGSIPSSIYADLQLADLDLDGKADAVWREESGITIAHSTGGCTFAAPQHLPGFADAVFVVGQLDGVNGLDLLSVSSDDASTPLDSMVVYLSQPDRTYGPVLESSSPSGRVLALGRFDGAPGLDLALAPYLATTVSSRSGNGDGTFGSPVAIATASPVGEVAAADMNGDGVDDLTYVSILGGQAFHLLPGDGSGAFGTDFGRMAGSHPANEIVADFDEDGREDVLSQAYFSGFSYVFRGRVDGTFGSPLTVLGDLPAGIALADLDQDGILDAIVCDQTGDDVEVHKGLGSGRFGPLVNVGAVLDPTDVAIASVTGDAIPDIVVTSSNGLSVFPGTGGFGFSARVDYATAATANALAIADLNGDALQDVVVAGRGGTLAVHLANGSGGFAPFVPVADLSGVRDVAIGDMNGDGKLDLVAGSKKVQIHLGNGLGGFGAGSGPDYVPGFSSQTVAALLLADVDHDGDLDVATVGSKTSLSLYPNTGGTLGSATELRLVRNNPGAPPIGGEVGCADFDGDGNLDLIASTTNDRVGAFYHGNGDGTFRAVTEYGIDGNGSALAIGDLDNDGGLDIAIACSLNLTPPGRLSVLMNQLHSLIGVDPTPAAPSRGLAFTRAWPSPGRAPLTIEFTARVATDAKAQVYDVAGRLAFERPLGRIAPGPNRARLEGVASLPAGLYWVRVVAGAETAVRKVVVTGN